MRSLLDDISPASSWELQSGKGRNGSAGARNYSIQLDALFSAAAHGAEMGADVGTFLKVGAVGVP